MTQRDRDKNISFEPERKWLIGTWSSLSACPTHVGPLRHEKHLTHQNPCSLWKEDPTEPAMIAWGEQALLVSCGYYQNVPQIWWLTTNLFSDHVGARKYKIGFNGVLAGWYWQGVFFTRILENNYFFPLPFLASKSHPIPVSFQPLAFTITFPISSYKNPCLIQPTKTDQGDLPISRSLT